MGSGNTKRKSLVKPPNLPGPVRASAGAAGYARWVVAPGGFRGRLPSWVQDASERVLPQGLGALYSAWQNRKETC